MNSVLVIVRNTYPYDSVIVENSNISINTSRKSAKLVNYKVAVLDGIFLHYFLKDLKYCNGYRTSFLHLFKQFHKQRLLIELVPVQLEIVDHKWNWRISQLVFDYIELDHALSWLSTLGGAFSALGDYFLTHAEIAGKISFHQLKLALKLNDANIVSRCHLYYSLSLIQKCKFKLAKAIILYEYKKITNSPVIDNRLVNMCKGIWTKLNYERIVAKGTRKINKLKL